MISLTKILIKRRPLSIDMASLISVFESGLEQSTAAVITVLPYRTIHFGPISGNWEYLNNTWSVCLSHLVSTIFTYCATLVVTMEHPKTSTN